MHNYARQVSTSAEVRILGYVVYRVVQWSGYNNYICPFDLSWMKMSWYNGKITQWVGGALMYGESVLRPAVNWSSPDKNIFHRASLTICVAFIGHVPSANFYRLLHWASAQRFSRQLMHALTVVVLRVKNWNYFWQTFCIASALYYWTLLFVH